MGHCSHLFTIHKLLDLGNSSHTVYTWCISPGGLRRRYCSLFRLSGRLFGTRRAGSSGGKGRSLCRWYRLYEQSLIITSDVFDQVDDLLGGTGDVGTGLAKSLNLGLRGAAVAFDDCAGMA